MSRFSTIAFIIATAYVWRLPPCSESGCREWSFPFLAGSDGDPACLKHARRDALPVLAAMVGA